MPWLSRPKENALRIDRPPDVFELRELRRRRRRLLENEVGQMIQRDDRLSGREHDFLARGIGGASIFRLERVGQRLLSGVVPAQGRSHDGDMLEDQLHDRNAISASRTIWHRAPPLMPSREKCLLCAC
jgi:hypothetical protein